MSVICDLVLAEAVIAVPVCRLEQSVKSKRRMSVSTPTAGKELFVDKFKPRRGMPIFNSITVVQRDSYIGLKWKGKGRRSIGTCWEKGATDKRNKHQSFWKEQ